MKTKYFIFAASALVALASCSNDEYIGENNGLTAEQGDGSIQFSYTMPNATRADFVGATAAEKLGNNFYVTGTKADMEATPAIPTASPTTKLVFDNYLVHYGANTAGETKSNTHNWEYVGLTPGTDPVANYVKLSSTSGAQTIKYWDYNSTQYDFLAFSTGTKKAVSSTSPASDEIGVTAMNYGTALGSKGTAYTFSIPSSAALKDAYISDIVEVAQANYGKVVQLKFKSLGSKVRLALYETVPGYSVKDVQFYSVDETTNLTDAGKNANGKLISADAKGVPTNGDVTVFFNHVGSSNKSYKDYNKASATVTSPASGDTYDTFLNFGTLVAPQLKGKERAEVGDDAVFLGRTLPLASFVGNSADDFYQTVFPVDDPSALTLRVDYTLVPIDGAAETIKVKGAKAVVPSTYTKWLPNYAYTYIFKISDNTNGWTGATDKDPGLFPITFDAVVAQVNDANAEQTTVTTVATPSITTYQQGHTKANNEYSKSQTAGVSGAVKDVYVQVMDNSTTTPTLIDDLSTANSLLFAVSDADASEAQVMDALQNRVNDPSGSPAASYKTANPTGRSGIELTADANISNTETQIVNGVDDEPITKIAGVDIAAGQVAKIDIDQLATGTYAYVYVVTAPSAEEKIYHVATDASTNYAKYYEVSLAGNGTDAVVTTPGTKAAAGKVYFIVNKDAKGAFVSYTFKQTKVGVDDVTGLVEKEIPNEKAGSYTAGRFYFDVYYQNNGKYAVKVIKVVD